MKEKKNLSAKEVAALLGTPLVTVQRWVHQGKIPCKFKKNDYFFKYSEIVNWARSHDFSINGQEAQESPGDEKESHILSRAIERGGIYHNLKGDDIYTVLKNGIDKMPFPEKTERSATAAVDVNKRGSLSGKESSQKNKIFTRSSTDRDMILDELLNREEIASTGIGKGVAIPHPRHILDLNLKESLMPMFFLKQEIDFNSVDGKPVFVLFFMFSSSTHVHLNLLSRLSFCLRDNDFISMLKQKREKEELLKKIIEMEKNFESN